MQEKGHAPEMLQYAICLLLSHFYSSHAFRNNKEQAFDFLEKTLVKGFNNWPHIEADTDLDDIRNDERYQKLLKKWEGNIAVL